MSEEESLVDSKSHRGSRLGCRSHMAAGAVLLTELLERTAFYGLTANFVVMLNEQPLSWAAGNAASLQYLLTGIAYISALIGGWIADSLLGKFKTIAIFLFTYIVGYVIFPAVKWDRNPDYALLRDLCSSNNGSIHAHNHTGATHGHGTTSFGCTWLLYVGVILVGASCGAIKANIAPFGADQINHIGGDAKLSFFNWFYWCVNVGSLLALGPIAYIQQDTSFGIGLLIPCCCVALGFLIFVLGRVVYVVNPPTGSIITKVFCVIKNSLCRKKCSDTERASLLEGVNDFADTHRPGCLDQARQRYGGPHSDEDVDHVQLLGKVFCVFLTMVPFWTGYIQMESLYIVQALHMRLCTFNRTSMACDQSSLTIPVAWLGLFDIILLIIVLPVMTKVYSFLGKRGLPLNTRKRIVIGTVIAMMSVFLAGWLEVVRLKQYHLHTNHTVNQTIGGTVYNAVDLSVFWQVPQYLLMGLSEAFASVASLELAYTAAPRHMQSIIMGLYFLAIGLAALTGIGLVQLFSVPRIGWFTQQQVGNINLGHLDRFFFLLTGFMFVGLVLFMVVVYKFDIGGDEPPAPPDQSVTRETRRYQATNDSGVVVVNGSGARHRTREHEPAL